MGLFKNKVGRPSNETLERRRKFYIIIVFALVVLVGVGVFYTVKYFKNNNEVSGSGKNAAVSVPVGGSTAKGSGDVTSATVNCSKHDGVIDIADVEMLGRTYLGLTVPNLNKKQADLDGDGKITFNEDVLLAEDIAFDDRGDIDFNGKITSEDARLILRVAVDLDKPSSLQKFRADLDQDLEVTANDSRIASRLAVGYGDVCSSFSSKGDGKLTNEDMDMMLQFYTGVRKPTSSQKKAADMNGDNIVNFKDVALAYKKLYPNAKISCTAIDQKKTSTCTFKNMKGLYFASSEWGIYSPGSVKYISTNNYTQKFTIYDVSNENYVAIYPSYASYVYPIAHAATYGFNMTNASLYYKTIK